MNDTQKLAFILKALKEIFGKEIDTVSPEDRLLDLGLDSLDIVELVMYYEDEMRVEVESDATLLTVGELMAEMK